MTKNHGQPTPLHFGAKNHGLAQRRYKVGNILVYDKQSSRARSGTYPIRHVGARIENKGQDARTDWTLI